MDTCTERLNNDQLTNNEMNNDWMTNMTEQIMTKEFCDWMTKNWNNNGYLAWLK